MRRARRPVHENYSLEWRSGFRLDADDAIETGMRRSRGLRLGMFIALAAGQSAAVRAQSGGFAIDRYLRDSIKLDAGQMTDIGRGRAVSKLLPTGSSRDVTVFGIIAVNTTRDAYVAYLEDARRLIALRSPQFGIINDPIAAADVENIAVDDGEYRDLRDCKKDDCNFKLPESTMRQFAEQVHWNSSSAKREVDSLVRANVQRFVADYRTVGNAAMVRYDDTRGTQASDAFSTLLGQSSYLRDYATALREYLVAYPSRKPADAHDVIYWSQDKIRRLRPTFTLTHMVVYTPPSGTPLIARKQIYASHYFEGAFELLAAFDASSATGQAGMYLVSVRRYRFDNLPSGGFFNIRGRARNALADLVRSDLEKERDALEHRS